MQNVVARLRGFFGDLRPRRLAVAAAVLCVLAGLTFASRLAFTSPVATSLTAKPIPVQSRREFIDGSSSYAFSTCYATEHSVCSIVIERLPDGGLRMSYY